MEQTTQKKPTLEMSLAGMKKIEDQVSQWMILEEHCIQNQLDRKYQLDCARTLFGNIKAEITAAYSTCQNYSEV